MWARGSEVYARRVREAEPDQGLPVVAGRRLLRLVALLTTLLAGVGLILAVLQDQIKHGYQWVPYVYVLVSILTGGAVLRAAARVFLGWGAQQETHPAVERLGEEPQPPDQSRWRAHTPIILFVPAVALLTAGIVADLLPGFLNTAQEAAARFKAPGAYDAAVLYGQHIGHLPTPPRSPPACTPRWAACAHFTQVSRATTSPGSPLASRCSVAPSR